MTRLLPTICIIALLGWAIPAPAAGQGRTPDTGMLGVGADIGLLFPDDAFETALTLDAYGEMYVTPRFSARAMLAWASPGLDGRTEDHFRQFKLLFNGVYNWEYGEWHPFVTAGAGAYFVRLLRTGAPDPPGETRGGINFGGGIEYFTSSLTAIKGEVRFDIVSDPPGLPDATGVTLTVGIKRYF